LVNKQKRMKTLFLILLVPLLTHLKRNMLTKGTLPRIRALSSEFKFVSRMFAMYSVQGSRVLNGPQIPRL
jgi:hypothetical protein